MSRPVRLDPVVEQLICKLIERTPLERQALLALLDVAGDLPPPRPDRQLWSAWLSELALRAPWMLDYAVDKIAKMEGAASAPRRAGTAMGDVSATEALRLIGDDPETLLLAIALMDRMIANRSRRARPSRKKLTKHLVHAPDDDLDEMVGHARGQVDLVVEVEAEIEAETTCEGTEADVGGPP